MALKKNVLADKLVSLSYDINYWETNFFKKQKKMNINPKDQSHQTSFQTLFQISNTAN